MSIVGEGTSRPPHTHRYITYGYGTETITEVSVDERGFVLVSEEMLESLLLEIGIMRADDEPCPHSTDVEFPPMTGAELDQLAADLGLSTQSSEPE